MQIMEAEKELDGVAYDCILGFVTFIGAILFHCDSIQD